jgi:hypothetical protein
MKNLFTAIVLLGSTMMFQSKNTPLQTDPTTTPNSTNSQHSRGGGQLKRLLEQQ